MSIKKDKAPISDNSAPFPEEAYNYLPADDIYNKLEQVEDVDPENIAQAVVLYETQAADTLARKELAENELDVPGAELDDELEVTGGEDEENNYYSLGHDNHNKFDEREGA
jgi:hypothetical protein